MTKSINIPFSLNNMMYLYIDVYYMLIVHTHIFVTNVELYNNA